MMSARGLSGEGLAALVEQFDPETARRYREVYARRNHAIHALHTEAGVMRQLGVTKRNRHIAEDPVHGMELIDESPVDFPLLIGIWYDMQSLRWEAQMAFLGGRVPRAVADPPTGRPRMPGSEYDRTASSPLSSWRMTGLPAFRSTSR
jgi:hypothetical protein